MLCIVCIWTVKLKTPFLLSVRKQSDYFIIIIILIHRTDLKTPAGKDAGLKDIGFLHPLTALWTEKHIKCISLQKVPHDLLHSFLCLTSHSSPLSSLGVAHSHIATHCFQQ